MVAEGIIPRRGLPSSCILMLLPCSRPLALRDSFVLCWTPYNIAYCPYVHCILHTVVSTEHYIRPEDTLRLV